MMPQQQAADAQRPGATAIASSVLAPPTPSAELLRKGKDSSQASKPIAGAAGALSPSASSVASTGASSLASSLASSPQTASLVNPAAATAPTTPAPSLPAVASNGAPTVPTPQPAPTAQSSTNAQSAGSAVASPPASAQTASTTQAASPTAAAAANAPASKTPFKDGFFVGRGRSRHGDIEALVEIENGRIINVVISQCLTQYSCSWITPLLPQVVARQSAEVDNVTGATHSADALYYAVKQALQQAK